MAVPAGWPRKLLAPVDRQRPRRDFRPSRRQPQLKSVLDELMASAYRYARRKAAIETEKAEEAFPAQCPWSFGQAMDAAFWPGQRPNHSGQNSASAA